MIVARPTPSKISLEVTFIFQNRYRVASRSTASDLPGPSHSYDALLFSPSDLIGLGPASLSSRR